MKHTLSCRVKDRPGVLSTIANSFAEKGINILSVAVAVTEGFEETRMTIVVPGEDIEIEEVSQHLEELDDIIDVEDLAGEEYIQRELVLVKVDAAPENIPKITQLLELFDAPIVDIGQETLTVEFSGPGNKVSALIKLLQQFGLRAVTRTGMVALKVGDEV
jgi:acetolactate synthase-1/3 small subunit